jgi:hypothetical protein
MKFLYVFGSILAAALTGGLLMRPAVAGDNQQLLTVDHYVPVRSSVPSTIVGWPISRRPALTSSLWM